MSDFMIIKPFDTLFFRNGKPFNAGENSWTDSSFLPNPSVIWGAMFGVLYNEFGLTKKEDKKKLKIKNIYLYNEKQTTVLLPAPLDIFVDEDGKYYIAKYEDIDFISNYPLKVISKVETDKEVAPIENSFIEINSLFQHYVNRYEKNLIIYNFSDVFVTDYKIGIEIDSNKKTAKENMLYRIDLTQFLDEWSFLIEYECDVEFKDSGILKFGGEGKTAKYLRIDKPIALKTAEKLRTSIVEKLENGSTKFFKILFKTPAYFKRGWQPSQNGLVCANVGKPISIGGWDMEVNKPKVMKRYVPAGSVYVFEKNGKIELKNEDIESYKGFGSFELLTI